MRFKSKSEPSMEGLFGGPKPAEPEIDPIQKVMTNILKQNGCDYGILVVETPLAWCFAGGLYGAKPGSNDMYFIRGAVEKCAGAIYKWTLQTRLFIFDAKWNLAYIHFDLAANKWGVELKYDASIDGIKGNPDTAKHADGTSIPTAVLKHGIKSAQRGANIQWM